MLKGTKGRDTLRSQIRANYFVSGFMAKSYDAWRFRTLSQTKIALMKEAKIAELMRRGEYQTVIEKASMQTDDLANKLGALAKTRLPIAKALAVGGYVAVAIEIPYRYYQLDIAKTDEAKKEALGKLTEAVVSGSFAAACLVIGIGSGGVGFLACGVAPVVSGLILGEAAKWVYQNAK